MKTVKLSVKNNDPLEAMRETLCKMLESSMVDAILVPKALPGNDGFVQSLVRSPEMLRNANALAPTMAVQSANIVAELTATPFTGRIAAVLKPCELRAVLELAKFLQVKLEQIVTIGVDCPGTYEVKAYAEMSQEQRAAATQGLIDVCRSGAANESAAAVRPACRMCLYPAPLNADMTFMLYGTDPRKEIVLLVSDKLPKDLADKLPLKEDQPKEREEAVKKVVAAREKVRTKLLSEIRDQVNGLDKFLQAFSTCIRCHNCMNVCPICYCKECVFHSPVFEHRAERFLGWAKRKGAIRMPTDTLIFHMTRLSHMATSCVGCGVCESACPNGLPVSSLFSLVGAELQEMFGYLPGKNIEEEPPVSVFKEDELQAETSTE